MGSGGVFVRKKDGSVHFCVDYLKLNNLTLKDAYPLSLIDNGLDNLSCNAWFFTLHLCSGNWQVSVKREDRPKAAFVTRKGLFQFRKMPFGLIWPKVDGDSVYRGFYLDGVVVVGRTFEHMIENLSKVLARIVSADLKLKPKKCGLFSRKVLGYVMQRKVYRLIPRKWQLFKTARNRVAYLRFARSWVFVDTTGDSLRNLPK